MLMAKDSGGASPLKKNGTAKKVKNTPPATIKKPSLRELPPVEEAPATAPKQTASGGASGGGSSGGKSKGGASGSGGAAWTVDLGREIAFEAPAEDAEARANYNSALERLGEIRGAAPQYDSRYDEQIQSLYEQITGRGSFRYDPNTDPLYRQYAQDYAERGKLAMEDTMGRAAALTGGYGSSYAQAVGQQQYDAYLRRLAEVLPQTYGMALDVWKAEGEGLQRQLETTEALERSDYDRYLDALGEHNRELDRAQSAADQAYERMIAGDERAYGRAVDDYGRRVYMEERDYGRRQDYYDRLVRLIAAGYSPRAKDYALAGMSPAQGAALRAQYLAGTSRSSGGGGGRKKKGKDKKTPGAGGSYAGGLNKSGASDRKTPNRR